jgi:hypothetical protein
VGGPREMGIGKEREVEPKVSEAVVPGDCRGV